MITIVINGQSFKYPETGDTEWGSSATIAFQALASTTLQQEGGNFYISNELDFGGDAGIKVLFISSRSNDPALSGVFRLSKGELVAWRNENNDGDNTITFDADGDLLVNGTKVTLHGQIVNDDVAAAAGIEESKLALDYSTDSLHTLINDKALYNLADTDLPDPTATPPDTPPDNQDVLLYDNIDSKWKNSNLLSSHVGNNSNPHLTNLVNLVDTTVATPTKDDTLLYDDIDSKWKNKPNTVANLKDTTISTPTSGDVLGYDGSKWVNTPSSTSSLSGLSDTDITTPANGDTLVYNSVSTKWENSDELTTVATNLSSHTGNTSNPHSTSVSNLTDTTITTPSDQDTVVYDNVSSKWINQANTLDNLKNTTITTPSSGDTLSYNGSAWVNKEDSLTNLTDTTITTPSDQDTLIYDGNSSEWVNQANTINNISNVSIDSNTLAVGDTLVFDDQDSLWKNDASFTNHIGNTSNPHLTTVGKLTDTSITTPANKDVLLYDYANSQWINSNIIEINDVANINTATTDITLTTSDKRHQIFDSTTGFSITLPSTGIKAGEKFVFDFPKSVDYFSTPFVIKVGANALCYSYNGYFTYVVLALADNPSSLSDWTLYSTIKNGELIKSSNSYKNANVSLPSNSREYISTGNLFTLGGGKWRIDYNFGVSNGDTDSFTISPTNTCWFYVLSSADSNSFLPTLDGDYLGHTIAKNYQYNRNTAYLTINGVTASSSYFSSNNISKIANINHISTNISAGTSLVNTGASTIVYFGASLSSELIAPITTLIS